MADLMEKIVSLCKRRGFIFQSSEIYGGFSSCYDFGPLGVEMKNNIKLAWWEEMIKKQNPPAGGIVGLDAAILMKPEVWQASGHLTAGFADELVECKKCHKRFKLDELQNQKSKTEFPFMETRGKKRTKFSSPIKNQKYKSKFKNKQTLKCPECNGELMVPRKFNLMMKTFVGPVEDKATLTYLRAETCQGIYMNFENVLNSMRMKIPFGICQIGKAFRNEITPKDFIYRTREFEQMELQWFCHPKDGLRYFDFWKKERIKWYLSLGIKKENLRAREVPAKERAHYAKKQVDIEYRFPFGWREIEGIHNRGDWDLSNHSKYSGKDLRYFDPSVNSGQAPSVNSGQAPSVNSGQAHSVNSGQVKEKYFPHIIETSGGADRSFLAFLCDAYTEIKGGRTKTTKATKEIEILLKLNKKIAPIKVAVLPLVRNKPELVKKAKEVYQLLKPHFVCQYDELGSIGRRYRRMDEVGTLFCLTVDFESLKQEDLTVRGRDTMAQERVKIPDLIRVLKERLEN